MAGPWARAGGGGALPGRPTGGDRHRGQRSIATPSILCHERRRQRAAPLTATANSKMSPAWSPDGRRTAFFPTRHQSQGNASGSGPGYKLMTAHAGQPLLVARRAEGSPSWGGSGSRWTNLEIYAMNADGSGQRRLTHNTVPDSRPCVVTRRTEDRLRGATGASLGHDRRRQRGAHAYAHQWARNLAPAWSPNGQRIAFERWVGRQKYRNTALEYGQCNRCDGRMSFQVYVMNATAARHGSWRTAARRGGGE